MYTKGDGTQQLVEGHEGRHRAMALARRGYTHMPVQIRSDIRWSEQKDPSKFDYREKWPTELVGENGDVTPFPVTREEADKSYSSAKVETPEVKAPGRNKTHRSS